MDLHRWFHFVQHTPGKFNHSLMRNAPEGSRLQASCVILLQLQCRAQIRGQPRVGNVSVLPSAADTVYSLAGAAGRTSACSDEIEADLSDSSCHFVLSPDQRGDAFSKLTACVASDVFEVTLTGRLLADCSADTCTCSMGQSLQLMITVSKLWLELEISDGATQIMRLVFEFLTPLETCRVSQMVRTPFVNVFKTRSLPFCFLLIFINAIKWVERAISFLCWSAIHNNYKPSPTVCFLNLLLHHCQQIVNIHIHFGC